MKYLTFHNWLFNNHDNLLCSMWPACHREGPRRWGWASDTDRNKKDQPQLSEQHGSLSLSVVKPSGCGAIINKSPRPGTKHGQGSLQVKFNFQPNLKITAWIIWVSILGLPCSSPNLAQMICGQIKMYPWWIWCPCFSLKHCRDCLHWNVKDWHCRCFMSW